MPGGNTMHVVFHALEELEPGERWVTAFKTFWPAYKRWFLQDGDAARPSYRASLNALREHMPELLPVYEKLCELAGGGDAEARFLGLYRPAAYLTGCSQAVWRHPPRFLVRNYDYAPQLWEALLIRTRWNGRDVIAMSDCFWGVLDGINDDGLAVSLAFGGSRAVGDGFGVPLILRYVLETCSSTPEAIRALQRVPSHMAYNVTVLDAAGRSATVFLHAGSGATVTHRPVATNHQRSVTWRQHAHATASVDRERFLLRQVAKDDETPERFRSRFLEPPLYFQGKGAGWATLYTASYHPESRHASYVWPGTELRQSFEHFSEVRLGLTYRP